MKYLKTYENINEGPKIGDYVYIKVNKDDETILDKFLKKNIGRVSRVYEDRVGYLYYFVQFDKISNNSKIREKFKGMLENDYSIGFELFEIVCWDENLETLKIKIDALKYNL